VPELSVGPRTGSGSGISVCPVPAKKVCFTEWRHSVKYFFITLLNGEIRYSIFLRMYRLESFGTILFYYFTERCHSVKAQLGAGPNHAIQRLPDLGRKQIVRLAPAVVPLIA
jgi:hypothetical protein